mgnify:CR=1 FL=1
MHIYDVKMALRDTFYGEPSVLYGAPHQDANALAALSCGIFQLRAMNGRHYWYFFMKDIKNRDLVRFLLRRNGHYAYVKEKQPCADGVANAFRRAVFYA